MTKCDMCGFWFDWYDTRYSDEFDEAVPLIKQMGYRYACKKCMKNILKVHKETMEQLAAIRQPYDGVGYYEL